jgi:hypothetical protein
VVPRHPSFDTPTDDRDDEFYTIAYHPLPIWADGQRMTSLIHLHECVSLKFTYCRAFDLIICVLVFFFLALTTRNRVRNPLRHHQSPFNGSRACISDILQLTDSKGNKHRGNENLHKCSTQLFQIKYSAKQISFRIKLFARGQNKMENVFLFSVLAPCRAAESAFGV